MLKLYACLAALNFNCISYPIRPEFQFYFYSYYFTLISFLFQWQSAQHKLIKTQWCFKNTVSSNDFDCFLLLQLTSSKPTAAPFSPGRWRGLRATWQPPTAPQFHPATSTQLSKFQTHLLTDTKVVQFTKKTFTGRHDFQFDGPHSMLKLSQILRPCTSHQPRAPRWQLSQSLELYFTPCSYNF